jgi:hypothetical protein
MSYRTTVTGTSTLAGSTAAVLVTGAIAAQLAAIESWAYASSSGSVFTFYLANGTALPNPLTLPVATLDGSLLGQQVLIDSTGGNVWKLGTIVGDGSSLQTSNGVTLPLTSLACDLSTVAGYTPPPSQRIGSAADNTYSTPDPGAETFTLTGTSTDGHAWFSNARLGALVGSSLTTLASITPGNSALVQVDTTTWKVVRA